jgi:DNA polymerase I
MSQKFEGWLLDLYSNQKDKMTLWIKRKDGSCIKLVEDWDPSIYVAGAEKDLNQLTQRLYMRKWEFTENFVKLNDTQPSQVLRIYTRNMNDSKELASYILSLSTWDGKYSVYNVDVPTAQSFLYERNLFPLAFVEVEVTNGKLNIRLRDSTDRLDYEFPPIKIMKLSIGTLQKGRLVDFTDELDWLRIRCVEDQTQIDSGSETEKLQKLVAYVKELDPDVILTENGDSFLFPYLARRALVNSVLDRFILGREDVPLSVKPISGRSYWSYNRVYYRPNSVRLFGRLHLDKMNSFLYDCGLEGLVEVARTCRIPLHEASRGTIGSSMTSIQLYQAFKDGYLIPWRKADPEDLKSARELIIADRGGFYYEPIVGIHDNVGEIDFSSLYPTLMLKKNLSAETIRCNCCPNSTLRVPELGYNICQKRLGIVPKSLELLLDKKTYYKRMKKQTSDPKLREIYNRRQAALKWILVCSFGYLGYRNARFGKIDAHIATCAFAREVLQEAVHLAEREGFSLVHGIVDGLWLRRPNATETDFQRLCNLIQDKLDLPIEFEGIYKWIIFLPSKIHPNIPVLNRYYGVYRDGRIKIRGLALRRRDTPRFIKRCMEEMLQEMAKAETPADLQTRRENVLAILHKYITMLRNNKVEVEDLIIQKVLSKSPSKYKHSVVQALAARQLNEEGLKVEAGETVRYIITNDRCRNSSHVTAAELIDADIEYNIEEYTRLLQNAASTILTPLDMHLTD